MFISILHRQTAICIYIMFTVSILFQFEGLKGQASRGKDEYGDSLKEIFGRTEDPKGDRYSMINVLSRRLKKAVKKDVLTDQVKMQDMEDKAGEHENASNEELYEQDFEDGEYDSLSSTIKSDVESIDERDDEQWTTIPSEKVSYLNGHCCNCINSFVLLSMATNEPFRK